MCRICNSPRPRAATSVATRTGVRLSRKSKEHNQANTVIIITIIIIDISNMPTKEIFN